VRKEGGEGERRVGGGWEEGGRRVRRVGRVGGG
jgi:hypothetical protein